MFPIHSLPTGVKQIENVCPVAMVPLKNVEFTPNKFLHGNDLQFFSPNRNGLTMIKPNLIYFCPSVCHGPDNIHYHTGPNASIDPTAVIRSGLEVIVKPSLLQRGDGCRSSSRHNV